MAKRNEEVNHENLLLTMNNCEIEETYFKFGIYKDQSKYKIKDHVNLMDRLLKDNSSKDKHVLKKEEEIKNNIGDFLDRMQTKHNENITLEKKVSIAFDKKVCFNNKFKAEKVNKVNADQDEIVMIQG